MDHVFTVKIPIKWSLMSEFQQMRYQQILKRDGNIINRYMGIIKQEPSLISISKSKKYTIDSNALEKLTVTSRNRSPVKYDIKASYPRISNDEIQECRNSAIANYKSYLELRKIQKANLSINKPVKERGRLSRTILARRFSIDNNILYLMDSMDSNWAIVNKEKKTTRHSKLEIPLKLSRYHEDKMNDGKIVALNLSESDGEYYANISIKSDIEQIQSNSKAKASMGIDLGMNKTAFSAVLTRSGIESRRTWHSDDKFMELERLETQVASLQRENYHRINNKKGRGNITRKLRELKNNRKIISLEYDRILVKELAEHIYEVNNKFDLYIGIGKLTGIRKKGRKGNGKGKRFRKRLNSWAFFRFAEMLEHKLSELGMKHKIFQINEAWTSIICYKCNTKGIRRKQSHFKCTNPLCGVRNNADFNGAMNIAKRTVKYRKLTPKSTWSKSGLGRFLKNTPKAQSSSRAKRSPSTRKNKVNSVSVHVASSPKGVDKNHHAMYKKYEKTILDGYTNPRKPGGKKRYST